MADVLDDGELIKRCLSGHDKTAWEIFVRQYSRVIWSSIHKTFKTYSFQNSKEDAEDIYSSVFLSLLEDDFRRLRQFRSGNACTLPTWLTVVTVRKTIDYIRHDKRHLFIETISDDVDLFANHPDSCNGADALLDQKQTTMALESSLDALSPEDRETYDLLFDKGLPPEHVAERLGVSVSAIYSRKSRMLVKMKKSLQENENSNV